MNDFIQNELGAPKVVDRSIFQAELDALRVREKAHAHEGDAIAAADVVRISLKSSVGVHRMLGKACALLPRFSG
jgi:hypothetical protein